MLSTWFSASANCAVKSVFLNSFNNDSISETSSDAN